IPATAASMASGRKTREKSGTTSAAPRPRRNDVGWICIVASLTSDLSRMLTSRVSGDCYVSATLRGSSCGDLKNFTPEIEAPFDWASFCSHTDTISRRARGGSPAMPRKAANQSRIFGGAETLSLELVHAVTETAVAAVRGAQEVGAEIGTTAVGAVRGSIRAAEEIGGDLGRLAMSATTGVVESGREVGGEVGRVAVGAAQGAASAVRRAGASAARMMGLGGRRPLQKVERPRRANRRPRRASAA